MPLDDLAGGLAHQHRFAGLHFLHPADQTAVVEVVRCATTSDETIASLTQVVRSCGKGPLVLRSAIAGYIWNRIQFAVLRECLHLLDEGVADARDIDAAVSDGLTPRWLAGGPFASADLGGVETFNLVSEQLFPQLANSGEVSPTLSRHADERTQFHVWTDEGQAEIERLRERALATGASSPRPGAGPWTHDHLVAAPLDDVPASGRTRSAGCGSCRRGKRGRHLVDHVS